MTAEYREYEPPVKPYAADLDDLPPPIAAGGPRTAARVPGLLSNALWAAYGVLAAVIVLGSPGCVGMSGGPAMSAKADVSVKETGLIARGGVGGGAGQGGREELVASVSFSMSWPGGAKGK